MSKILKLKITLRDISPPIWQRFLVEDPISFHELHKIIREVMGWENYHLYDLYDFKVDGLSILESSEDYDDDVEDSKKVKLNSVLTKEKQKFAYIYDFGDTREYMITIKKILEKDNPYKCPVCVDGKRACPPEDYGGVWGYEELLKIKKNKNHPEYEEKIIDWLGEDFNPEHFDLEEINKSLRKRG